MRALDLLAEGVHGRHEPLVAKDERLDRKGQVAKLANRRSLARERALDELGGLFLALLADRGEGRRRA